MSSPLVFVPNPNTTTFTRTDIACYAECWERFAPDADWRDYSPILVVEARVAAGDPNEEEHQRLFDKLLRACGQRKVPNRPGRKFPRELILRRHRYVERKRRPPDSSVAGSGPVLAASVVHVSDANTHQQP